MLLPSGTTVVDAADLSYEALISRASKACGRALRSARLLGGGARSVASCA